MARRAALREQPTRALPRRGRRRTRFRGAGRFHVPGHKGGPGADPGLRYAIGDRTRWLLDVPQDIRGIDVGPSPTPYERAELLAAEAYGARALVVPHQRRDAGQPRALPGARAARARRSSCSATRTRRSSTGSCSQRRRPDLRRARVRRGARHGPRRHAGRRCAAALDAHAGRARRVHRLADLLRDGRRRRAAAPRSRTPRASPLVVDQSWGAHFGFHPDLPPSAAGRSAPTRCSRARTRSPAR